MQLIKTFLIGLIGLFFFITLASLLMPSKVQVSRTVVINDTSISNIVNQINNIKNWSNWHPMFQPNIATITYQLNGCSIAYNNKLSTLTLVSTDSTGATILLQSANENDISNKITCQKISTENGIEVRWTSNIKFHWYPWEKFYAIFIDKIVGPSYDDALAGLKKYVEGVK